MATRNARRPEVLMSRIHGNHECVVSFAARVRAFYDNGTKESLTVAFPPSHLPTNTVYTLTHSWHYPLTLQVILNRIAIASICPRVYRIQQDTWLMLLQTRDSWVDMLIHVSSAASARDIPVYPICHCIHTLGVSCRSR